VSVSAYVAFNVRGTCDLELSAQPTLITNLKDELNLKTLNESFTEEEFEGLKQSKGCHTWHDFILSKRTIHIEFPGLEQTKVDEIVGLIMKRITELEV
jgi:hypothetical protein